MEQIMGETPDISEYLDFGFYDWVWYKDNAGLGDNCIALMNIYAFSWIVFSAFCRVVVSS